MESRASSVVVRRRLVAALPGLLLFIAFGALYAEAFWTESWFYVGLGTAAAAIFVEPFFTKPQDAIVTSLAGIGAVFGTRWAPVEVLWFTVLSVLIGLAAAAATAALAAGTGTGTLKWAAFRLASRLGRAAVVGPTILGLTVLTAAARGESDFEFLAIGTACLTAALAIDWAGLFTTLTRRHESATAVAAVGPRMLLVSGTSHDFAEGETVDVEAGNGACAGSIVSRMPHPRGLYYQVALADEWTAVCAEFPHEVILRSTGTDNDLVGAVGDATTERTLQFEPFRPLEVGTPVCLRVDGSPILYQVARLRLTSAAWAGAHALLPHATARLVGWPDSSFVRGGTYLPRPHDLIYRGDDLSGQLPSGYYEIGTIKGTAIPLGIRIDEGRRGHLAVLGMSGMGKTAVAQRICKAFGTSSVVVALDTTGEYGSRLGFPAWQTDDFDTSGHFVHEPAGDPPAKAAEFIKSCMSAGATEYQAGGTPTQRVVLLEEAHTFVPEWNFALRNQQDHVALSTRAIMQARKFGVLFIVVSQRTAVVSKSALSQCENYVILKTLDQTSLDYLEALVGREMRDAIPSLERYEALCVGPAFNAEEPAIVTLAPPT